MDLHRLERVMIYLYALIILIVLFIIYMRFEASFLEIKRIRFTKKKNCLKILHISDLHINRLKVSLKKTADIIQNEKPDIVILTGDYIENRRDSQVFIEFLRKLKKVTNVYLCLGNHDYTTYLSDKPGLEKFLKSIEDTGALILQNHSICIEKNSKKYNIIGIDDLRNGSPDIEKALSSCSSEAFINIAFSHNPDIIFDIPRGKIDYLFCGHFHGGQICLPFNLQYKILRKDILCKKGINRGLHKLYGINLYINRGLGNVIFPLRFRSRPEITIYYMP